MFRIWVPDFDSPSYFVAIAAVELDLFKQEGIDIEFVHNERGGPELMLQPPHHPRPRLSQLAG